MSKSKYLHVKNAIVVAVTFEGEKVPPYGEVVEVAMDAEIGVGDAYAPEAPKAKKTEKAKAE